MKYKILIVDDCQELLEAMKNTLRVHNFEVVPLDSGIEALQLLSQQKVDIMITDIQMPFIDGFELHERIERTMNINIPLIFMTGEPLTIENTLKAIKIGVADIIKKPFGERQLINIIKKQISKSQKANKNDENLGRLMSFYYTYLFTPQDFVSFNVSEYLVNKIMDIMDITPAISNQLTLIIEEMVSNAFIHGTFNLGKQYRELDSQQNNLQFKKMINCPEMKGRSVNVNIVYSREENIVTITVTNQGEGFEWQRILEDLKTKANNHSFDGSLLKGLNLIKILSDDIGFHNKGRTIRVIKKLDSNLNKTNH